MARPIYSLPAEQAVIARVLLRPEQLDVAMNIVKPDDFYDQFTREMFIALCSMALAKEQIDAISLHEHLTLKGVNSDLGWLCNLVKDTPAADVHGYCESVKEYADYRRLMFEMTNMTQEYPESPQRASELVSDAQSRLLALGSSKTSQRRSALDMMKNSIDRIDKIANGLVDPMGIPYGIPTIDTMTMGARSSQMIVIAGRPGDGKTNAGVKILRNAVFRSNKIGIMFTLEMEGEKITDRVTAAEANIPSGFFKNPTFNDADCFTRYGAFLSSQQDKIERNLFIYDDPSLTPTQIRARCLAAHREAIERGDKGLGVVVIDYLQLVTPDKPTDNRANDVGAMSRFFKKMAMELGCPVVILSQLNRAGAGRSVKDSRPRVTDLRESGAIEQDADVIILLFREESISKKQENIGVAEWIVGKQREGETGIVAVDAAFNYNDFRELETHRLAAYMGTAPLNNTVPDSSYNEF